MKPNNDKLLRLIASSLATEIYPQINSSYHQAALAQIIELLVGVAADLDQAASRLIEENHQIRAVFGNAVQIVTDSDLKERLEAAIQAEDTDFTISALDKSNQALMALLIELHAQVEIQEGEEAKKIETAIWQELTMRAMRRLPAITACVSGAALIKKT
jgi:hypothetical protein